MENIRVRLGFSGIYGSIYNRFSMRTQRAASSRATMPRLALNRKDTGGYSIGSKARWPPKLPENACSVAVSWPGAALARTGSRNRGYIAS
jgi:hypothetical protein